MDVSDPSLVLLFVAGAAISLTMSWVLVSRIERVGARVGVSEALLGMLAALAADAPELTAAVTALAGHHPQIGAGVVIGSNVFNLAALLGLGAVVAGHIALHRRVIVLEGIVAVALAVVCVLVVIGPLSPLVGFVLAAAVLLPYLVVLGIRDHRLRRLAVPNRWREWLATAVHEEELELEAAIHPRRGRGRDVIEGGVALLVVVGASILMEQSASKFGTRHAVPQIIVGGLVLAAVTSVPNAVAAVYLAARGRGAATLSTAMNSNALNVAFGLLLPGTIVGLGRRSGAGSFVALYYFGMTVFALAIAYRGSGLRRARGALIIAGYVAFAVALTVTYTGQ